MFHRQGALRLYVRLGCFLLAVLLLLPLPFWADISKVFVQASPFVAIGTILASRAFAAPSILGLVFAAISLVRKRWFCRYVCPVGLILDAVQGMKSPATFRWKRCPPVGHSIVGLTAAGAIVGYPILLWMDPLAFLSSAFSVHASRDVLSAVLSLSGLVLLLLIALTSGDLWCARLCPLGATQDLLHGMGSLFRNLRKPGRTAVHATPAPGKAFSSTRRSFITLAAGLGLGLWAQKVGQARSDHAPLRPPGAVKEDVFAGLCLRCGNCIRACPSKVIRPDTGQAGILGLLSPAVRYETNYCLEECNACTQVCPSGAIQALNLKQKQEYVIGEARVDRALCLFGISDCNACVNACYWKAIQVLWDEEAYESYPQVDPLKCNGCGACEACCPTGDVKAIRVWKKTA